MSMRQKSFRLIVVGEVCQEKRQQLQAEAQSLGMSLGEFEVIEGKTEVSAGEGPQSVGDMLGLVKETERIVGHKVFWTLD